MSSSRKGAAADSAQLASDTRSNSARRGGEPSSSTHIVSENAPGKSTTLTGTGQAALNSASYTN